MHALAIDTRRPGLGRGAVEDLFGVYSRLDIGSYTTPSA
jgi:hypothetical protein